MKKLWTILLAAALGLGAFAACGFETDTNDDLVWTRSSALCNECLERAPEPDSLAITIPENDKSYSYAKALGDLAEYYDFTVDISRGLNNWILGMLSTLDEILSYPPTDHDADTCIWGPFIPNGLSPVEVRFSMTKISDTEFEYVWDQRLKNTDNAFQAVWGGMIQPSTDTARRGIGNLFIDWTTAHDLDPTWDVTGRMDVEYDTYTDGRQIDIVFTDFQNERDLFPTNATYHYHNRLDNSGEFLFEYAADAYWDFLGGTPGQTELETITQKTLWHGDGEGVSVFSMRDGDVTGRNLYGDFTMDEIEGYECWNDVFERTYFRASVISTDGEKLTLDEEGVETDCGGFAL
ncbi:MAG: hypothetical protein M5R36_26480 [Deltaproteobacteria bacterium]|nr:hypothetical protein [Deltaproteobacteria bacterium]